MIGWLRSFRERVLYVVILDIRMPQGDGLTCLRQLRASHPAIKVVMLSDV